MGREWDSGDRVQPSLGRAAALGALAGLAGGAAMMALMKIEQRVVPGGERIEPPPRRVVEHTEAVLDTRIPEPGESLATWATHMAYAALLGSGYGMLKSRLRGHPNALGLLYGALVWAANFMRGGLMPRFGALPPPGAQPPQENLATTSSHVVYGLVTSAVYEALE